MSRQRIGLLVGQPDEVYQKNFIAGFLQRTFSFDYDVCVFAMYKKYQESTNREIGESNIFSLIPYDSLDGIVVLADTLQTTELLDRIESELHTYFGGAVLFVDKESRYFPSISTDHFHPTKKLIAHLIEHHGFTKIAYLTGKTWHPHSIQRLNGFMDSMAEHGLEIRQDWIFEGDFWYTSGESMVEKLLKNPEDLPQAIACANDCMAIGVANALEKKGIRVPEDIAVIGYDSSDEGKTSPKPLTSAPIPSKECGKHAGSYIHALLSGEYIPDFKPSVELFIGSSCGCECDHNMTRSINRDSWEVTISERDFLANMNCMMDDLMCQNKLTDLMNVIFSYTYQIQGFESFHLCLNSQWENMRSLCAKEADWKHYSSRMLYALECRESVDNPGRVDTERFFDKTELLPGMDDDCNHPKAFFFTPLHFEDRCMGYAVVSYGNKQRGYDETYCAWLANVMRGLESFRRLAVATQKDTALQRVQEATSNIASFGTVGSNISADILNDLHEDASDASISKDVIKQMSDAEKEEQELVEKILNNNLFSYHFQPIVDAKTGEIFSYEALMRADTEKWISPLTILKHAENMGRLYDVEKYTFTNILRYISEHKALFEGKKIFLNSIPGVRLSEDDRKEIVELVRDNQGQVVVELTEQAELNDASLSEMKERYEKLGVETAIDDYGTGYSNITNLLRYMPRYVKVDRMLLSGIQNSPQKQHFVKEIIEFSHDNNIVVLAEGIETCEELQTVIHLGADLIQGYYTARPNAEVLQSIDVNIKREIHQFVKQLMFDKSKKVYTAGKEFRISLAKLHSDEYEYIVIPNDETTYRDLHIIGVPGMDSHMIIQVADGYKGRLTLNNVVLGGKRGVPCIDIGEDCDLTLELRGENELRTGGVRVPENAKFTLEGDGTLEVRCNYDGCFAIGNDMDKRHGNIIFDQDGTIEISTNAKNGVAIGSGLGGKIEINRGKYIISLTGNQGVAVGSIEGPTDVSMKTCDMTINAALYNGVGIGSISGDVTYSIKHASLSEKMDGIEYVGIGSFSGEHTKIIYHNCNSRASMHAMKVCGIGCMERAADIDVEFAAYSLDAEGDEIIIVGDRNEASSMVIHNSEVRGNVQEKGERIMGIDMSKLNRDNGRFILTRNKELIEL